MGKKIPINDQAVHRVQTYLTKKDYTALEKLALKKKASLSALVADIIKSVVSNPI